MFINVTVHCEYCTEASFEENHIEMAISVRKIVIQLYTKIVQSEYSLTPNEDSVNAHVFLLGRLGLLRKWQTAMPVSALA